MKTSFNIIYDSFLSKIQDDMYLELTELDTFRLLQELLVSAISLFEFPRVNINDYDLGYIDERTYKGVESDNEEVPLHALEGGAFNVKLSEEEINILSTYMITEWLGQQIASVENTRMKYSGSDFKFTSQANHLAKLIQARKEYERLGFHYQRLYKRRKADVNGIYRSTMNQIMDRPSEFEFNED